MLFRSVSQSRYMIAGELLVVVFDELLNGPNIIVGCCQGVFHQVECLVGRIDGSVLSRC